MNRKILLVFVFCQLLKTGSALAQETRRDSTISFFGVPLLFYSPDTRWGIGAAGIVTFPTHPRRSSVTFNFSVTQNKQILIFFPFQWLSHRNRWRVYGEVGWYYYLYRYFGIGNEHPNDYVETYTAKYPRIRISGATKLSKKNLLGLRVFLDDYHLISASEGGEIAQHMVTGASGGVVSSVGPVWISDSRDNVNYPRSGWLMEFAVTGDHRITGSNFRFVRASADIARYFSIGNTVLAANAIAIFTAGEVPFFQLPQIGGQRRLRGYPDGKFRDRHLAIAQAEWRFPLIWRFKGVIFAGAGSVFGQPGEKALIHPNGGAGLRIEFDKRQKLRIRVDYGIGEGHGNSGVYVTLGEAF